MFGSEEDGVMKKLILALLVTTAVIFGFGGVAEAYPPSGGGNTVSNSNPAAGADITFTTNQCVIGESVRFVLDGVSKDAVCAAGSAGSSSLQASQTSGSASAMFTDPAVAGTYTCTISGSVSGDLGSVVVTVAAQTTTTAAPTVATVAPTSTGGLPATGSDGIGATTGIAVGLLVAGLGLFGVATVRRRQPVAA